MWQFSCEETVYFPFIFWTLIAIKHRAPPLMGWETKGLLCGTRYGNLG